MPTPSDFPDWATNTNYSTGPDVGTPTKVAPTTGDVQDGNIRGAGHAPESKKFNWWMNLVGLWIRDLNSRIVALFNVGTVDNALVRADGTTGGVLQGSPAILDDSNRLQLPQGSIGETITNGLELSNPTAATSGNQQWSPSAYFRGFGWSGGASIPMDWAIGSAPSDFDEELLSFRTRRNGGSWFESFAILRIGSTQDTFVDFGRDGGGGTKTAVLRLNSKGTNQDAFQLVTASGVRVALRRTGSDRILFGYSSQNVHDGAAVFGLTDIQTGGVHDLSSAQAGNVVAVAQGTATFRGFNAYQNNAGAQGGRFQFLKSRGTHASPAVVQNGDGLGRIEFHGFDGTAYFRNAYIDCEVEGSVSSGVVPTQLAFYTGDAGSAVKRLTIRADGQLWWSVQTAAPVFTHEPLGNSVGGTMAVLGQGNNSATLQAGTLALGGGVNAGAGPQGDLTLLHGAVERVRLYKDSLYLAAFASIPAAAPAAGVKLYPDSLAVLKYLDKNGQTVEVKDPQIVAVEDFCGGSYPSSTQASWPLYSASAGGTGAAIARAIINSATECGVVTLSTGTGTSGYASIYGADGNYQSGLAVTPSASNRIICEGRIYIPTLSNGTDTFRVFLGLSNGWTAGFPTIGAGIEYLSTSSANWRLVTMDTTGTSTNSSVVVTAGAWHKFRAVKAFGSATSWEFFVDGVSLGTQSTNAPTSQPIFPLVHIERVAGDSRDLQVDRMKFTVEWTDAAR